MKNKILSILGFVFISFSLVACNSNSSDKVTTVNENSIQEENNTIESEKIEVKSTEEIVPIAEEELNSDVFAFYASLNVYVEDFYRNYNLLANSIDDNDTNDYNYYFTKLQTNLSNIEKLKEPACMTQAKQFMLDGLKAYRESGTYLKESFEESDYDKYNQFIETSTIGAINAAQFLEYCDNLNDYVAYLSSLKETSFYLSNYNLYSKKDAFSEEENKALFILNHKLYVLSQTIDDSFIAYSNGEDYKKYILEFSSTIEEFKTLDIDNENLKAFRDELVICLDEFIPYYESYFKELDNDNLQINFEDEVDISKNARRLYDAMSYMQAFYKEYDMTIDFTPTTDYTDVTTTYEIEADENDNLQIIGEETQISE